MDYGMKQYIDPASVASLFQRKRLYESDLATQQQNRVDDVIKMATNLTDQMIQNQTMQQQRNATNALSSLLGKGAEPVSTGPTANPDEAFKTVPFNQTPAYKEQLLGLSAKLNPQEASKRALDQAFPLNKPKYEVKAGEVNGAPINYVIDPIEGVPRDLTPQHAPIQGVVSPKESGMNMEVQLSDADRKDPLLKNTAKMLIEGRATPTQIANLRTPKGQKAVMMATELDPSWDVSLAGQRASVRKDFAPSGKNGQSLQAISTAIGHLDSMLSNGQNLNNDDIQLWNKVKNSAQRRTGSPKVDKFLADRDAVTSELGRVFQTTGVVTQAERDEFRQRINEASSPEQINAVAGEWVDLLKSRTDTIKEGWKQSMGGTEPPTPFLTPKAKQTLVKRGYDPNTLEKTQKQPSLNLSSDVMSALMAERKRRGL